MAKTVKGYDRRFSITSTHPKRASLKDGKYRVGTRMADISSVLLLARVFCGPVAEHLY
jgi:hypothetical protein